MNAVAGVYDDGEKDEKDKTKMLTVMVSGLVMLVGLAYVHVPELREAQLKLYTEC